MSPAAQRIVDWIEAGNTGTVRQIAPVAGLTLHTAREYVSYLRKAGRIAVVDHVMTYAVSTPVYGKPGQAARTQNVPMVARAIASRTALEVAWA